MDKHLVYGIFFAPHREDAIPIWSQMLSHAKFGIMMYPHEFLEWHNQIFHELDSYFNCGRKYDFR
jgi:hypothetical protein